METTATVDTSDLAEELGVVLARFYGFLRRAILPTEMTLTQSLALSTLRDRGPQRVTDLAGIEGVRQPTCTGLVNTMEAQGWVTRSVDEGDRRVVRVELTHEGRVVLDAMTTARAAVLERYLGRLPDGERAALARALPSLRNLIELGTGDEQDASTVTEAATTATAAAAPDPSAAAGSPVRTDGRPSGSTGGGRVSTTRS